MTNSLVDFENLTWVSGGTGVRSKELTRGTQKIRLVEFSEEFIEQAEKEKARLKAEATARRDNLQYSVVLIFLLILGAGLLVMGRFSIPIRIAEGLIFFSFLIFFEFILVLADPYIEIWSSGGSGN